MRFDTGGMKTALRQACDKTAAWANAPFRQRYAALAFADLPNDWHTAIGGLRTWPVDAYRDLSTAQQLEVLQWLIDNVVQVKGLDKTHAWLEQWHLARIALQPVSRQQAETVARALQRRGRSKWANTLFVALEKQHPTPAIAVSRITHLVHNMRWRDVIAEAPPYLERFDDPKARRTLFASLTRALLERGQDAGADEISDAERAWHTLMAGHREGLKGTEFDTLMTRVTNALLPSDLVAGRAEPTNFIADGYRGLARFGKGIGKLFGGREATVPYSEGVVLSAPEILTAGQVEAALDASDRHAQEFHESFKESFARGGGDVEAATVAAAITVGSLWTLSQVDSTVLDAMTFSSAGNPEAFGRLRDIAQDMEGNAGAAVRLSGYVAEQQVAVDLARNGHVVEFPETANQQGFDLLVDGHAVQVKCSLSADYVLEHLDKYPDIPVIVNAELADQLGDHPMVWIDQALIHAEVNEAADTTVAALSDFGDSDDLIPIPLLSVAFAAYRNYGDLKAGRIDNEAFAYRTGVDAAARAVGGGAGGLIGGALGSIVGPAGTVVGSALGGFLGSVAGGTGADRINRDDACDAREVVVAELGSFARWFHKMLLTPRVTALTARRISIERWADEASAREWAPACTALIHAAACEAEARAVDLEAWFGQHTADEDKSTQAGWVALREAGHFLHPKLKLRLAKVKAAMNAYQRVTGTAGASAAVPQAT